VSPKPFQKLIQTAGLRSVKEWKEICKQRLQPAGVPLAPQHTYSEEWISSYDWLNIIHNSTEQKNQLIKMAREEAPRSFWKTKLGLALLRYTSPNSASYDSKFDEQIRKLAPHWFLDTAKENKQKLLEMARAGESRPSCHSTRLGSSLANYISKNSSTYDPKFDKKIRQLAPTWFANTSDEKRKKLLERAFVHCWSSSLSCVLSSHSIACRAA